MKRNINWNNLEEVNKYKKEWCSRNREKSREQKRKWKYNNKSKNKEIQDAYVKEHREIYSIAQRKYANNNPKIIKAHRIARNIPLNSFCEICGSIKKLRRHHWRYDKPLLFNTLCNECHSIQHRRNIL